MTKVLIVDDEKSIRQTVCLLLAKEGYVTESAPDVMTALELIKNCVFDIVITDIIMPRISGLEFLKKLHTVPSNMQIIVMTGEPTVETAIQAVQFGANDYLVKPIMRDQLVKVVKNAEYIKKLNDDKNILEKENQIYQKELETLVDKKTKELQNTTQSIISLLSTVVESRDPYTAGHQRKVGNLAANISKKMGLTEHRVDLARITGYIHDLGKISVPAEILSKPGRLNVAEMQLIQMHPISGYDMITKVSLDEVIGRTILQHHERCDGSGYPYHLRDDELLLEAKIIMVADVVEAMMSHRPYRPAVGLDAAIEEITKNSNKLYSAAVVSACRELLCIDKYELEDEEMTQFYQID